MSEMSAPEYEQNFMVDRRALDGVRSRRIMAFVVDFAMISVLVIFAAIVLFFLSIITFGLGFLLYAILVPAVALIYTGATLSSPQSATWGMRVTGLKLVLRDGAKPDFIYGAVHAVLFYFSLAILTPFILLFSLLNGEKRLLHDIILGGVVVRID